MSFRKGVAFAIALFALSPYSAAAISVASPTASASTSTIAALQSFATRLAAEFSALTAAKGTSASPASESDATPVPFTRRLALGSTGAEVSALQQRLQSAGFYSYPAITGYFGVLTEKALAAFQSAHGLDPVGYAGPKTRALLNDEVSALGSLTPPPPLTTSTSASSTQIVASSSHGVSPGGFPTPNIPISIPALPGYSPGFGGGAGDLSPPSISITAPSAGATVFGDAVMLAANAADNSGIAWVQFAVDGSDIGSEIAAPPYSILWNSLSVADGPHTIAAIARDGAGNSGSASVALSVRNSGPVISAIASSTVTASSATITWTTDETGTSQIAYGLTSAYGATTTLDTTQTTSHSVTLSGLSATTLYHFQVLSTDPYGNLSLSSDQTFMTPPTLPALPFAAGAPVSAIGDSIIGFNNGSAASFVANDPGDPNAPFEAFMAPDTYEYGEITQALAADPQFDFDTWYDPDDPSGRNASGADNGVFSDHLVGDGLPPTPGILNRLPAALSHHPDILIFEGGTNTINSEDNGVYPTTEQYVESEINDALIEAREAGVWVILTTIRPRGDWPAGDPRYQTLDDVNAWIRAQTGRDGVYAIWDPFNALALNGYANPALFQSDLVHPNTLGAYVSSQSLIPILQNMIAPGSVFNQDPTVSNLQTDGAMLGTTGTKSTGTTGTVPTGYTVAPGNATVVASEQAVSSTTQEMILTITPLSGGTHPYDSVGVTMPNITSSLPAEGSWIQTELYLQVSSTTDIGDARLNLSVASSSTDLTHTYTFYAASPTFVLPGVPNWSGWLVSTPMQVPPGEAYNRITSSLEIYFPDTATDTPVVTISRLIVRQVPDPRIVWGF